VPAVSDSRRKRAALRHAALGWRVLPLHTPDGAGAGACSCGRAGCPKPGKHPRCRHGVRDATSSADTISAWWSTWPNANVGLATGALLVIDVDGEQGISSLQELQHNYGPLPTTLEATTRRGRHLYFTGPSHRIGNSAGRLGEGLDVRGHGGYVVAPPSLHADGHIYQWRTRRPPAALPAWVTGLLTPAPATTPHMSAPQPLASSDRRRRYFTAALQDELAEIAAARAPTTTAPGTRNETLNRAAFRLAQLAAAGYGTLEELQHHLLRAALAAGLSEPEARATLTSGLLAGQQSPRR
jgi:hypothetical protein